MGARAGPLVLSQRPWVCLLGHAMRGFPRTLLLPWRRNILIFHSEAGRTDQWAQAHFFVAAGGSALKTGLGRGVSGAAAKNSRSR